MLSGAIPQYLHVQPEKPVKGQAAICDWLSNISSYYFDSLKVQVKDLLNFNNFSYVISTGNYMFKVNNRNSRTKCEIYSKLTIKIPE